MDLMLDGNVILDHIGRREPFCELSRRTCLLGIIGEANTFISANTLTDIYYLLKRDYGSKGAQGLIENSLSFLQLVGISPEDMQRALPRRWSNFEDCLVACCAEKIKADYIVTRNVRSFRESSVEAITPQELFVRLECKGFAYEEVEW